MYKWGPSPLFRSHFLDFLILFILLNLSIRKFLTLFILLIHSFYTNNINFLNILRKSGLSPPFLHTKLMRYNKITINIKFLIFWFFTKSEYSSVKQTNLAHFLSVTFKFIKRILINTKNFTYTPNISMTLFVLKTNQNKIT